jgi:hypothetical protein
MKIPSRLLLLIALHWLAFLLIGELNNLLSPFSLYLHLQALLVAFFGLYLQRLVGAVHAAALGLFTESLHPVPTGSFLIAFLGLWLFFVWARPRIQIQNPQHVRIVATSAQAIFLLALSAWLHPAGLLQSGYLLRVTMEIAGSAALTALLVLPWCRLNRRMLQFTGWNLATEWRTP